MLTPRQAMTSKASMALMKFLADLSRSLGVGRHVYVVGGAVRNFVIDVPVKDVDVVIDTVALRGKDSEWFAAEVAKAIPAQTNIATNQYGVALLHIVGDWMLAGENIKGEDIEIANARKESYGEGGYKPHMVEPATIEEDVVRREFSFNTLLWRLHDLADGPDKAEIIDLTGCGLKDLKDGVMRCPSSPDKTFSDDPSRMVRAVKFLVKYGFKIDPEVRKSIVRNKAKLKNIPHSALSNMLINTFLREPTGKKALIELDKLGLLAVIKEIAQEQKAFREALAGWADREAKVEFIFDLMDLGLPSGKKLKFLDRHQQERVRSITVELSHAAADAYVAVLKQPGKSVDTRTLMQEFDLKGKDVRRISAIAQRLLLADPALAADKWKLTEKVRIELRGGRTASNYLEYGEYKDLRPSAADQIPGGVGDKAKAKDVDPKQLAKGIKVEMEHTNDKAVAREIALDHLSEPDNDDYYDRLETIEKHARTAAVKGTGGKTGLMLPLPPELAKQFPPLGDEDGSPTHCTFLYVGDVQGRDAEFLRLVEEEVAAHGPGPVRAALRPLDYFTNPMKDERVAICPVRFGGYMDQLRDRIRIRLLDAGFEIAERFPLVYSPHVTLAYLPGLEATYEGTVPTGSWMVESIAVWGLPKVSMVPLTRTAKTYTLNKGDPLLMGKYLNSPGRIESFGENDKGDPTVMIRKTPKGDKGQGVKKEVKVFKVRYDKAQAQRDKERRKATHSRSKCMECSKPPTHECRWAEGRARAWFCDAHWKSWSKEHADDIDLDRKVDGGEVGVKWSKKGKFGPNTPLMNLPDAKVKYRMKSDSGGVAVAVYYGRTRIGGMNAFVNRYPETDRKCSSDVWKLLEKYPQIEDTSRDRWVAGDGVARTNTRALQVFKAFITDESKQGMGIGKAMYIAMMAEWFKKVGPFIFMPYNCTGSGTSNMALRVWSSLARSFPSSGNVIAVLKKPNVPAEGRLAIERVARRSIQAGMHSIIIGTMANDWMGDMEFSVPSDSLALLFNQRFADSVLESDEPDVFVPLELLTPMDKAASRVAAKFQNKKEVPKAKGKGTTTVYEYSEGQIQHRNRDKAKKVEKLRGNLGKLRSHVTKDLKSKDDKTRLNALVVGLMNDTYERVGNDESAKDGHFGVTGWQAKHVSFSGNKATITYVGKSGVKQSKTTTDSGLVSGLKAAIKGKSGTDPVFDGVDAGTVNEYLKPHGITAKDIRGLHANREVQTRLKVIRGKGGTLPSDDKKRKEKLKKEFEQAVDEAAKEVGHEPATLRSQYLVPGIEDNFLRDGTVKDNLAKQGRGPKDHFVNTCPSCGEVSRCRCMGPHIQTTETCWDCKRGMDRTAAYDQLRHCPDCQGILHDGPRYHEHCDDCGYDLKITDEMERRAGQEWVTIPESDPRLAIWRDRKVKQRVASERTWGRRTASKTAIIHINNATDGEEGGDLRGVAGLISSLTYYERAIIEDMTIHDASIEKAGKKYKLRGHLVDAMAVGELIASGYLEGDGKVVNLSGPFIAKKKLYTASKKAVFRGAIRQFIKRSDEAYAVFGWGQAEIEGTVDPGDELGGGVIGYAFRLGRQWFSLLAGSLSPERQRSEVAAVSAVRHPYSTRVVQRIGTKTQGQKEQDEVERLQRRSPKKKPPRKDLRRERMKVDDADMEGMGADGQKDLSLNYKKIALRVAARWVQHLIAAEGGDSKKRKPGDVWKSNDGTFSAMNAKGVTRSDFGDDEDKAKAYAQGSSNDPDEAEAEADAKKKKEDEAARRAESKEIKQDAQAALEAVKDAGLPYNTVAAVRRMIDSDAMLKAFKEADSTIRDELTGGPSVAMMKDADVDPMKGVDLKDPDAVAHALVLGMVRDRVLLNPSNVGGKPLSSSTLDDDALTQRAVESFKQFKGASKDVRANVATRAALQLAELDPDSDQVRELNKIIDGLQLAAAFHGDDIEATTEAPIGGGDGKMTSSRLLREPLSKKMKDMSKLLVKQGRSDLLLAVDSTKMFQAEGRAAVRDAMGLLDDAELIEMSKGSAWEPLSKSLAPDADVEPGVKEWLRAFMLDMGVSEMTTVQGIAAAYARDVDADPNDPLSVYTKATAAVQDASSAAAAAAAAAWLDCIQNAGSDPDNDVDCDQMKDDALRSQITSALDATGDLEGVADPQDPAIAVARHIQDGGDLSVVDEPLEKQVSLADQKKQWLDNVSDPDDRKRIQNMSPDEFEAMQAAVLDEDELD